MPRRRIRTLFAALPVVGLLAAGSAAEAGPETAREARTGSFTALSYNVAGLPEALSGSEPTTNSPLISPLLNAYDVVLLQENWQDHLDEHRKAGRVPDEVPPTMYHHLVVRDADHPFRSVPLPHPYGIAPARLPTGPPTISDGLNRLSRFPFTDIDPATDLDDVDHVAWSTCHGELYLTVVEETLGATGLDAALDEAGLGVVNHETDGGSADCGAEKGFSVARTEVAPGVTIDVYNLHADAGGHERDEAARVDNFAQLADHILDHSAGHAVILGGDTNLKIESRPSDGEVWESFQERTGLIDVCAAIDCGDDDAVIDKFAFRSVPGLEVVPQDHSFERERFTRAGGVPLSDHDPLVVRFRWVATRGG